MVRMLIHDDQCKGCGLCQAACPKKILIVSNQINAKGFYPVVLEDIDSCTGCALCARMCPDMVIEIYKETA
jgi:2-oxoglutarate ferredoxin oxidoreductase subunit delta